MNALGWVKTVISDIQTVLLDLDDGDLDELAQVGLCRKAYFWCLDWCW